jgi:hypothetical protein
MLSESLTSNNTSVIYKIEHYRSTFDVDYLFTISADKTLIKYETSYNLTTECEHTITTLKEFDKKIETLIEK